MRACHLSMTSKIHSHIEAIEVHVCFKSSVYGKHTHTYTEKLWELREWHKHLIFCSNKREPLLEGKRTWISFQIGTISWQKIKKGNLLLHKIILFFVWYFTFSSLHPMLTYDIIHISVLTIPPIICFQKCRN